jgi:pyrroline-5-carboxylate reductase
MKPDSELRITIIGMGHLMEAIFDTIAETVGKENIARQVNATTADAADGRIKQESLGIPVIVDDNTGALRDLEPDIIFFAPPPTVAPEIIHNELKVYFDEQRGKSATLPEIYAYPPVPPGAYYQKILGEDVLVVNLIPGVLRTIGGRPAPGATLATYPSPWPEDSRQRMRRMMSVLGGVAELKSDELIRVLAASCMGAALPEVILSIASMLAKNGYDIDHQAVASYVRARNRESTGAETPGSIPCSVGAVEDPLRPVLDQFTEAWLGGVPDYLEEVGFPREFGMRTVSGAMDRMLWLAQAETEDYIRKHTETSATKGGVLERALINYSSKIEPAIVEILAALPRAPEDTWRANLRTLIKEAAHDVRTHGDKLAGDF